MPHAGADELARTAAEEDEFGALFRDRHEWQEDIPMTEIPAKVGAKS